MSNSSNCQEISRRNRRERRKYDNKERTTNGTRVIERTSLTKTLKYYYDRFRYYHFYIADKLDTIIAAICLWIIKLYFSLMGYGPIINETETMIEE
ncbi:hypothetical protein HZH68_016462 [Vespula germanica]|uniref:Uncharacterized protein n=1 Tax=Vespula germanica TaxID=30212 RepID=A0A834MPK7_VESGE|nr:hypothetical protein HZH68_016462 [Vespula germanica]